MAVISIADTDIDTVLGEVVAKNQTSFSQWALISNASENSLSIQGPTISGLGISPQEPGVLVDAIISVYLDDDTGRLLLYYAEGGSNSCSTTMDGSSGSYTGIIPGSSVTQNGILYYVTAQDPLGFAA